MDNNILNDISYTDTIIKTYDSVDKSDNLSSFSMVEIALKEHRMLDKQPKETRPRKIEIIKNPKSNESLIYFCKI